MIEGPMSSLFILVEKLPSSFRACATSGRVWAELANSMTVSYESWSWRMPGLAPMAIGASAVERPWLLIDGLGGGKRLA